MLSWLLLLIFGASIAFGGINGLVLFGFAIFFLNIAVLLTNSQGFTRVLGEQAKTIGYLITIPMLIVLALSTMVFSIVWFFVNVFLSIFKWGFITEDFQSVMSFVLQPQKYLQQRRVDQERERRKADKLNRQADYGVSATNALHFNTSKNISFAQSLLEAGVIAPEHAKMLESNYRQAPSTPATITPAPSFLSNNGLGNRPVQPAYQTNTYPRQAGGWDTFGQQVQTQAATPFQTQAAYPVQQPQYNQPPMQQPYNQPAAYQAYPNQGQQQSSPLYNQPATQSLQPTQPYNGQMQHQLYQDLNGQPYSQPVQIPVNGQPQPQQQQQQPGQPIFRNYPPNQPNQPNAPSPFGQRHY